MGVRGDRQTNRKTDKQKDRQIDLYIGIERKGERDDNYVYRDFGVYSV